MLYSDLMEFIDKNAFVYIMSNPCGKVLYTGVTNNLSRRVYEHKSKLEECFTKKYNVTRLVYYEVHHKITEAIYREKMIKKKSRRGKVILIESINKEWKDLYPTL
jgi:putative endonuclease